MTVPTRSTFEVQLFFLLWSAVCFPHHIADLTTPSGLSFRGAWLAILPLLRFFSEWEGWGHPSALSSLHIHHLLPEVPQADTLHNSTPALLKISDEEIQLRMSWLFWSVQWMVQMGTYLPDYELFPNNFPQEPRKFLSWVCKKVRCQTMSVLGLEWITRELKINFQRDMWMFLLPSHKHQQNFAITIFLLHTHLFLWTPMNDKRNETHTHKNPPSAFSSSLLKWMLRLTVAQ